MFSHKNIVRRNIRLSRGKSPSATTTADPDPVGIAVNGSSYAVLAVGVTSY
jgi:hypothetical protein